MTPLPRRTDAMRNDGEAHSYLIGPSDREQRLRGTSRDAGDIVAEIARHLIRKNDRCSVLLVEGDRSVRTDLGAVAALRASLQEQCFVSGTGRTQPIRAHRRSRLFRHDLLVFGKFLCRFGNRNDRILEEVSPAICRIVRHKSDLT